MSKIYTQKLKNKSGKEFLLRVIKDNEVFKKLSEIEQFTWIHVSNCMLNLNMTLEQIKEQFIENEMYNDEIKNTISNVYNLYLKDIISQNKIKKDNKIEFTKIRLTAEEKRNLQIQATEKQLTISSFIREKINLK